MNGTIYAGADYFSGKAIYTTPHDAPLSMTFDQATEYCAKLDAHGHKDRHVPTLGELDELFDNRAAIGGFDLTRSSSDGWYWSSQKSEITDAKITLAAVRRFKDGNRRLNYTHLLDASPEGVVERPTLSSLRCVR